jgi:hypothetical protein
MQDVNKAKEVARACGYEMERTNGAYTLKKLFASASVGIEAAKFVILKMMRAGIEVEFINIRYKFSIGERRWGISEIPVYVLVVKENDMKPRQAPPC